MIAKLSDNGRTINVIPSISSEEQLRQVRLQKDVQFKEYQRPHSEKKKSEEKPDTYPPNTCVLMGDSILNGIIEKNLSNNGSVKGNAQFIFLCNPQKSSVNVCLMKILKSTVHKKSICVFVYPR